MGRISKQMSFLPAFLRTEGVHTLYQGQCCFSTAALFTKKAPRALFSWLMLDLEKIKIVFPSGSDDLGIAVPSGVRLMDLFPSLLGDLTESVGIARPNLLIFGGLFQPK